MYNYLARQQLSKYKIVGILVIIVLAACLITSIRWYAVTDTVRSYARAYDVYEPEHALFLWIGHREFLFANRATTLSNIAKFISDFLPLLALPLMLILFGTDNYYKDRRAGIIQIICTKQNKNKYIIAQLSFCFVLTFLIIAVFLVAQLVVTLVFNRLVVVKLLPVVADMPYQVSEYIPAICRLGLYYAMLSISAYAVSLFIKRVYVIILLIPVLLSMGSTVIMIKLFLNDPLALAFMDSGLAHNDIKYYWLYIIALFVFVVILTGIRLLIDRTHEIID